jgi:hypothetical protein
MNELQRVRKCVCIYVCVKSFGIEIQYCKKNVSHNVSKQGSGEVAIKTRHPPTGVFGKKKKDITNRCGRGKRCSSSSSSSSSTKTLVCSYDGDEIIRGGGGYGSVC